MRVELNDVIDAVGGAGDDATFYYNTKTQSIAFISDWVDDDSVKADLEEHRDRYISLPDKYVVDDRHLMETFIEGLPDGQQRTNLERAIRGRGAFHHFRELLDQFEIIEEWYDFQDEAYEQIARRWCTAQGIEIIKDLKEPIYRYVEYHKDKIYGATYYDDENKGFIFDIRLNPCWYKIHGQNDVSQLQPIADDMAEIKKKYNVKGKIGIRFVLGSETESVAESDDVTGKVHFTENK